MSREIMTVPRPFVFVLMPFSDDFEDVYQLGIKAACTENGTYCERVDEQLFDGSILERVYNQIAKADVIVADMTGRNANVYYEVGYAHALGKRVILLVQDATDIPFDLKQHPHVIYNGRIARLKELLGKRLAWAIEHPGSALAQPEFAIQAYVDGKLLQSGICIETQINDDEWVESIFLRIDLHNPSIRPLSGQIQLIFAIDQLFIPASDAVFVQSPDGEYLYVVDVSGTLLPSGWASYPLHLRLALGEKVETRDYPVSLQILTEADTQKISFTLRVT